MILESEIVLEDDYPVYWDYVYIMDGRFQRSNIQGTVADLKRNGIKEVRRCDLMGHPGARIGDPA